MLLTSIVLILFNIQFWLFFFACARFVVTQLSLPKTGSPTFVQETKLMIAIAIPSLSRPNELLEQTL